MQDQETDILSARESRIAVALFEIMKPQIKKLIDQLIIENNQGVQTITDLTIDEQIDRKLEEKKSKEFDIGEYSSEINDMIEDYVRYNITITSTID